MTKRAPTASPLALAAILAASAFPATMASAQEAATPPVTAPEPAPAPAPVIVLPPVDAAPAAPAPAPIVLPETTAQSAPEPAASPSARAAQRSTAPVAARTTGSRATEPNPAVAAPASGTEAIVPPAPVTDAAPVSALDPATAPVAETAPPAAPEQDNGWLIPLALGGIAIGGGIAYAATASNRRRKIRPADPVVYREARNEARAPVREPVATSALASTVPAAAAATAMPLPDARVEEAPAARRTFQEPVRLPSGPIPTGAERQALIERMVAAAPDATNPFHSRKTRRKRARILVAAAEHRQRTSATEPFDFRRYESFSQQEAARNGTATVRVRETVN